MQKKSYISSQSSSSIKKEKTIFQDTENQKDYFQKPLNQLHKAFYKTAFNAYSGATLKNGDTNNSTSNNP